MRLFEDFIDNIETDEMTSSNTNDEVYSFDERNYDVYMILSCNRPKPSLTLDSLFKKVRNILSKFEFDDSDTSPILISGRKSEHIWEDHPTEKRKEYIIMGDLQCSIWTNHKFRSAQRMFPFLQVLQDVFAGKPNNNLIILDKKHNTNIQIFEHIDIIRRMTTNIIGGTDKANEAFSEFLKCSYALVERKDVLHNAIDFCLGFNTADVFMEATKCEVGNKVFGRGAVEHTQKYVLDEETLELMKDNGISMNYLDRLCYDENDSKFPKYFVFSDIAFYQWHAYKENEDEKKQDILKTFPDGRFRIKEDLLYEYRVEFKGTNYTVFQLFGGHYTDLEGLQNYISLVIVFNSNKKFKQIQQFLKNACEYVSKANESYAINEDFIDNIETGELESNESDDSDDYLNYEITIGISLAYNRRQKEDIVHSLNRIINVMPFIRKHSEIYANPDTFPNGSMDWSSDKDNDMLEPINIGIVPRIHSVKEVVQLLYLLRKATYDEESRNKTCISIYHGPYDTDIQFTKFSALESLIQNQTDGTHYYDYPSADHAYRKIMKIFWILTEKKFEPLEAMRKTFTTYDDQVSFIENVFEANYWGETNVEQNKWWLAMKYRCSFEIKRSDVLESGIDMNIYGASMFIPSSVNKMGASQFENNTDEILTVEKVIYNQCIIQGRSDAYYVAMCFKPIKKAEKRTPVYTSVILFSKDKEKIEDFIKRVIGDNYVI